MKGIYYDRHCGWDSREDNRDDWHEPVEGENIVLNREAFYRFFPEVGIQGEIEWRCENAPARCGDCESCGHSVKITFGQRGFTASHTGDHQTHNIDEFRWGWSGNGATEHWFNDGAICLKSINEYRSGSGLTADSSRIVAYNRKVEVDSFRGDCRDETRTLPESGKIWAEFINSPAGYRANWTGFGMGSLDGGGRYTASGGWISDATSIIGDALDQIIEAMLSGNLGTATVCRHNHNVQAHIIASDPAKVSLYLCKSCRMRGVRWEEFSTRNRRDTCPYFRRACKSVVEKSDSFPEWFAWGGDNLLSSNLRMKDGEHEAYEVVYIRRKEGFVRRAVLLLNDRTREAWLYRYNGFIPRTIAEFREKYLESRQIQGYLGTQSSPYQSDAPMLTEAMIKEQISVGVSNPLWANGKSSLISFDQNCSAYEQYAIRKGDVGGFRVFQVKSDNSEQEAEVVNNASVFYEDESAHYYLLYSDWLSRLSLCQAGTEFYRSESDRYGWFLLRIEKSGAN
jgi:hypothetical protein